MLTHTFYYKTIPSPVGPLRLVASDKGLCAVLFNGGRGAKQSFDGGMEKSDDHSVLKTAEKQLNEYFAGRRQHFDLPLDLQGSMFQLKAWKQLQKIPYGETISYGE